MIRVSPPGTGLVQRLRRKAERIAARHLRTRRRNRAGGKGWRSASDLWPDFTDDTARS